MRLTRTQRTNRTHPTHRPDAAGFTVIELAIGAMLAAIVGALMLSSLVSAQQGERHLEEISASQEDLRRALVEITKDIRAAEPLWFDASVTPTATPGTELRLERWERNGTTPTYIRWHITGGELVRDVVSVDPSNQLQTDATTYRLPGVDDTLTGFAYYRPTAASPYSAAVNITAGAVDWQRLNNCTNRVFLELRAATLRGRHPTSVRGEINLRNRGNIPAYC